MKNVMPIKQPNFVAKHAREFNRASVEPCGKLYKRKPKHTKSMEY